jgi:iron complex transport system substrate-binding protein
MKKINLFLGLLLIFSAALSACTPTAAPAAAATEPATQAAAVFPMTLTDGLNRKVTLNAPAKRIVSLAPSTTEMLYAIGAGSQMVGRDSFSDYPSDAAKLTDVGGSSGNYSYETVKSLNPDLVIAAGINTADQVKALENLGLTVYYVANPVDFANLFDEMVTLGQLTGHENEAKTAVAALGQRVDAVKKTIAKASTTPLVLYELDGTDPAKPWTTGPGNFMNLLISLAGGKNVGSDLTSSWAQISLEDLLVKNPDLIILGDSNYGITPQQVAARTGWASLNAVKNNRVFGFDDNLVSRMGPRMVDGLEALAKLIHPELFKAQAE